MAQIVSLNANSGSIELVGNATVAGGKEGTNAIKLVAVMLSGFGMDNCIKKGTGPNGIYYYVDSTTTNALYSKIVESFAEEGK